MTKIIEIESNQSLSSIETEELKQTESSLHGLKTFMLCRQLLSEVEASLGMLFSKHSLSFGRYNILMVLAKSASGLMPSELAHQCQVTQATVSGLISGLEKSQIIERQPHHHDGRASVIKLTQKGIDIYNQIHPEFLQKIEKIFFCIETTDVTLFNGLLAKFSLEAQKDVRLN